jgi:hypothetical protein
MELQQAAATDSVSVGAQLRQAREARGMSIESVSNAIKLAPRQVEAIESDDFGQLAQPDLRPRFHPQLRIAYRARCAVLLGRLDQQHVCATPQLIEQANVGVTMPNAVGAPQVVAAADCAQRAGHRRAGALCVVRVLARFAAGVVTDHVGDPKQPCRRIARLSSHADAADVVAHSAPDAAVEPVRCVGVSP